MGPLVIATLLTLLPACADAPGAPDAAASVPDPQPDAGVVHLDGGAEADAGSLPGGSFDDSFFERSAWQ